MYYDTPMANVWYIITYPWQMCYDIPMIVVLSFVFSTTFLLNLIRKIIKNIMAILLTSICFCNSKSDFYCLFTFLYSFFSWIFCLHFIVIEDIYGTYKHGKWLSGLFWIVNRKVENHHYSYCWCCHNSWWCLPHGTAVWW